MSSRLKHVRISRAFLQVSSVDVCRCNRSSVWVSVRLIGTPIPLDIPRWITLGKMKGVASSGGTTKVLGPGGQVRFRYGEGGPVCNTVGRPSDCSFVGYVLLYALHFCWIFCMFSIFSVENNSGRALNESGVLPWPEKCSIHQALFSRLQL